MHLEAKTIYFINISLLRTLDPFFYAIVINLKWLIHEFATGMIY